MIRLLLIGSLLLIGCAAPAPAPVAAPPPPPAEPAARTHAVPIDEPLPAPESDQVIVELRVIHSDTGVADALALPTTLPSDAMLLTRLRACATLGKPFVCDATVQETSVRVTGTIAPLDGGRYRASLNYIERLGPSVRQLTTRVEVPVKSSDPHVVGSLMGPGGQDFLVLTIGKREK